MTQRYAVEGSFVAPSTSGSSTASASATSILALAQGLEVVAKVTELDIGQLQPGQKVKIVADAIQIGTLKEKSNELRLKQ